MQLGLFGRWNFKRIEDLNANRQLLARIPPRKSPEFVNFLWELVGGQLRYSGPIPELTRDSTNILFADNITFDIRQKTLKVDSEKYGHGAPSSLFYLEGKNIIEKKQPDGNLSYSAILTINDNKYTCVLMDPELAKSMLMRLFFFGGNDLRYFKPFINEMDLTRRTQVMIYQVDWNQLATDSQLNTLPSYQLP